MDSDDALLDLVGLVYEAALAPGGWGVLMERLAAAFNALALAFVVVDDRAGIDRLQLWTGPVDHAAVRRYNEYYIALDEALRGFRRQAPGSVDTTDRMLPSATVARSEFYHDFLRPLGLERAMGGFLLREQDRGAFLAFQRGPGQPPFTPEELARYARLVPHLQRALQVHGRLAQGAALTGALAEGLDRLSLGVVVLDAAGRALHLNRAAETVVARRDGLWLDGAGRLGAVGRGEARRLERLVAGAALGAAATGAPGSDPAAAGGMVRVGRAGGGSAYAVLVSRLSAGRFAEFRTLGRVPAVLVLVRDPDGETRPAPAVLAQLYGLTPSEGRLAAALAVGERLGDYAERAGISLNTVRFHLKAVFAKTGTASQAALAARLLRDLYPIDTRLAEP